MTGVVILKVKVVVVVVSGQVVTDGAIASNDLVNNNTWNVVNFSGRIQERVISEFETSNMIRIVW